VEGQVPRKSRTLVPLVIVLPHAAAMAYRKFILVRFVAILLFLGVLLLVFERELSLPASIGLVVGLLMLAVSAQMER